MKVKIQGRKRRVTACKCVGIVHCRPEDGRQDNQYTPKQIAKERKRRRKQRIQDKRDRRANQAAKMVWKAKA